MRAVRAHQVALTKSMKSQCISGKESGPPWSGTSAYLSILCQRWRRMGSTISCAIWAPSLKSGRCSSNQLNMTSELSTASACCGAGLSKSVLADLCLSSLQPFCFFVHWHRNAAPFQPFPTDRTMFSTFLEPAIRCVAAATF